MNEGLEATGRRGDLLHGNAGKEAGYKKVSRALRAIYLFQFMTVEGIALVLGISRQNAANLCKKLVGKNLVTGYRMGDHFCYFLTKDGEAVALLEFQYQACGYTPTEYHGNPSTVRTHSIFERLMLPHLIGEVRYFMENEYHGCGEFEKIEVLETTFSLRLKGAACQPDMILGVQFANGVRRNIAVELESTSKTPRELDQKFLKLNTIANRRFNSELFDETGTATFDHVLAFSHIESKAREMEKIIQFGATNWEKKADNQWYVVTERRKVRIPFAQRQSGESREACTEGGEDENGNPLFVYVVRPMPRKRKLDPRIFLGVRVFRLGQYGQLPKVP